ncbi:Retrovirus-related Pol polyprotein from type-2 retrotransposable element R2DM; Endonuclease [Eumeta japonica]|uniref:Retrovirus-related Pol polyprotein from type-2 retrotransposable element R2DM Endonuclease n=1 Tax=Eumeta variegata TaxID=151549 RepID=A0A4C1SQF4_EUMVA|nr:Retrovirus-related Pol polyprotein from type-2 retrotransposable element R2DM; Endonuclease [Eumeta japonica]
MQKQTIELKESITNSVIEKMEEKLKPVIEENKNLKVKITKLENEIEYLKRDKKQNNIIVFGLEEREESTSGLIQEATEIFNKDININIEDYEINTIYRIEDYTKEVLEKRKLLQTRLKEEIMKGNFAYLKYDKLVVKENNITKEKRKREISSSPKNNTQVKKQTWTPSQGNRQKLQELELALNKIKWDIIGISEVRRLGEKIENHGKYILHHIGETPGLYGVGFLAYSPTEPLRKEDITKVERFYEDLQLTTANAHKNIIVMGDFNGQIGKQKNGEDYTIGIHGVGNRSGNGSRVVSFAIENKLSILNSFYKKKPSKKWTWITPNGLHKNEIDLIMSNNVKVFKDISVLNDFNFNSDHRMVRAKLSGSHTKKARKFHNSMRAIECTGDTDLLLNNLDISLQNGEKENECISIQEKYTNLLQQLKLETKKVNMISKTEISLKRFVDFNKAFDTLEHDYIWDAMNRQGVQEKYIRIIKNVYTASTAKVKLEYEGSEFPIKRGVRQGDPISPKIFSAVLEMIFRNLNWTKNGLNINGENLNHLRFADDLILFSEDARTLEIMLQQLSDESVKAAYRQIKWRWTGHMSRENIEKWSRLVTEWYPRDGKRSRGRPNKRWEDDLRKIAGPVWSRLARDRDKWKSLEEAFVDRQAVQQKQPVAD